ncbi:hypothetical protein DP090_018905 [Pseudomonas sp. MDMC216]|uniref:Uncharacterized protein n=1 Tax=Ectopseudomonas toyotomiensis TaxID=554344 RepID=A0AA42LK96_9GAMM|nr:MULTISPECIES: hypothetical protein [Pseudomonas]MDH0700848.1 hypothetical protein [Pseudomonas toyotomiensis]MDH1560747.1 hypothetical protein [Pseudomonas chengduensis]MDI5995090.1 hypothetical protein [Pseudomonas sp. MDMC216]MDI6006876.1 hypothetical protein [Pseudomonas sp. MDMC17]MDP3367809.1 hypothetical protein [Pseudomonas sp.]
MFIWLFRGFGGGNRATSRAFAEKSWQQSMFKKTNMTRAFAGLCQKY